jgi:hypothetical protein
MQNNYYDELLARQQVMNPQTWATLQRHGVTDDTQLRLDFSYNASNHESAMHCVLFFAKKPLPQGGTDFMSRYGPDRGGKLPLFEIESSTSKLTRSDPTRYKQ